MVVASCAVAGPAGPAGPLGPANHTIRAFLRVTPGLQNVTWGSDSAHFAWTAWIAVVSWTGVPAALSTHTCNQWQSSQSADRLIS